MAYDLPSTPYWQPALGQPGQVTGLEDLAQAVRLIVTTPKGAVPLRPDFGCGLLDYLDHPSGLARARMIREVAEAVHRWEPRVQVTGVRVDAQSLGHASISVSWMPKESPADAQSTRIEVGGPASGLGDALPRSAVGVPGGVAPLDAAALVPLENLPKIPGSGGSQEMPTAVDGGELL